MSTSSLHSRIFGLDVLRSLAIILVVAAHGRYLVADTIWYEFPYINYIDGVDLFFVLSGFLIGTILLKEINKEVFGVTELTSFWKRRWFRTLPNYYLILILNLIIAKLKLANIDANYFSWKYLFFLQNFTQTVNWFFVESWSLSVEEWFYIFSPLLLMLLMKFFSHKKAFLFTIFFLLLVGFVSRFYQANFTGLDGFDLYENTKKVVITRIDAIGYGLLMAWGIYYYQTFLIKWHLPLFIIGVMLLCLIANYDFGGAGWYTENFVYALSPISVMLFLPFAFSVKTAPKIILVPITFISTISYSMYLINLLISEIIKQNFLAKNTTDGTFKYVVYWLIVIVTSALIYRFFEKPVMNLRDKKFLSINKK